MNESLFQGVQNIFCRPNQSHWTWCDYILWIQSILFPNLYLSWYLSSSYACIYIVSIEPCIRFIFLLSFNFVFFLFSLIYQFRGTSCMLIETHAIFTHFETWMVQLGTLVSLYITWSFLRCLEIICSSNRIVSYRRTNILC